MELTIAPGLVQVAKEINGTNNSTRIGRKGKGESIESTIKNSTRIAQCGKG